MYKAAIAGALLGLAPVWSGPVIADAPAPFPKFEAKRVSPPGAVKAAVPSPMRKRITVQIDPEKIKDSFLRQAVSEQLTSSSGRSTISLSWDGVSLLERLTRAAKSVVSDTSGNLVLNLFHPSPNV